MHTGEIWGNICPFSQPWLKTHLTLYLTFSTPFQSILMNNNKYCETVIYRRRLSHCTELPFVCVRTRQHSTVRLIKEDDKLLLHICK